ncbi:MAG: prokaryotic E2 ligase family D protein [Acidobacteriota bacterium]|nr:prokaryotic E2 ligase family D protein [Acidobacteriota bacterium]
MSQIENQNFFAPPADAKAALFFLEGHYQLNWREGSVERTKFLSPAQIGRAFSTRDVFDSGWLETNVIRFARGAKTHKILSVLPAGRRKIFITDPRSADERDTDDETTLEDTILEVEIPLPTLLLLGSEKSYYLWATLDKAVGQKSKICAAPFPNLDSSGGICFGTNTAPECRLDTIESVWRLILDSPFNNHQAANRCRTHADDARKLLFGLKGKKTFPKNALIKTQHTVAELWQSVR